MKSFFRELDFLTRNMVWQIVYQKRKMEQQVTRLFTTMSSPILLVRLSKKRKWLESVHLVRG